MTTIFTKSLRAVRSGVRMLAGLAAIGAIAFALTACGDDSQPPSTSVGATGTVAPVAEVAPPPQVETLEGSWAGWLKFDGGDRSDYGWTFRNDGTFVTSFNTTGTWTQNGTQVTWRFRDSPNTTYVGTLANGRITGTMSNSSGKGVFEVSRGAMPAPPPPPPAQASLAGAWSGYWTVTSGGDGSRHGEKLNVNWSFNNNGDFIDGTGGRVGSWSQNGNNIQFSFDNSTVFKGSINGNRVSGTFALPQGGGVSGDFVLTR